MDVTEVIQSLKNRYPDCKIIQSKNENGVVTEVLCEIEPSSAHPEYSTAIAVIDSIHEHYHRESREVYKIQKGSLRLTVNGKSHILSKGDEFIVNPNQIHSATGDTTWIRVRSEPGWVIKDHILTE